MRIHSKLCHIDENRAIVKVSAWENETALGSSLGEGASVFSAEENAIKQLLQRLELGINLSDHYLGKSSEVANLKKQDTIKDIESKNATSKKVKNSDKSIELPLNNSLPNNEDDQPCDWSKELTEIDHQVKKLNWDRKTENEYLKEKLNLSDRNRITSYKELKKYLAMLKFENKEIHNIEDNDSEGKKSLLQESNEILKILQWDVSRAREFLYKHMNVTSRQELDIKSLISFNNLLKIELSDYENNKY